MVGRELQRRPFESVAHALRYFLDPLSIGVGGIFAFGSSTNQAIPDYRLALSGPGWSRLLYPSLGT